MSLVREGKSLLSTRNGGKDLGERTCTCWLQMEEMMDLVQAGAVQAIDLRQKQEELRETDQNYIQVRKGPGGEAQHCAHRL